MRKKVAKMNERDELAGIETAHAKMVTALAKPGADVIHGLTINSAHLLHMAVGISGEAGELLDAVKKSAIYVKPIDRMNVVEELGDLEFYMEGLRQGLGITRKECLIANQAKLAQRYPQATYSNQDAQVRADKADGEVTGAQLRPNLTLVAGTQVTPPTGPTP